MKKWMFAAVLVVLSMSLFSYAAEEEIRQAIVRAFPGAPIKSITLSSFDKNWYEVVIGSEVVYVNNQGRYLMAGSVIDLVAKKNITQERIEELNRIDIQSLPLDFALKQVQGDGSRVLISFADPFCGYCRLLNAELKKVNNITVYTFLYPVISPESLMVSEQVWCSPDRNEAWQTALSGNIDKLGATTCDHPIDEILALGESLQIRGVPALIFPDGRIMPGFRDANEIEALLETRKPDKGE